MKKNLIIVLIFFVFIIISGWNYTESKFIESNTADKFAIMRQATSNSYEYKIDLGTSAEYSKRADELNNSLSKIDKIDNEIDALDYILRQGFELHSCLYMPGVNKIVYILKEKKQK